MAVKKKQRIEGLVPKGVIPNMGSVRDLPPNETLRLSNADPKVPRNVVEPDAVTVKRLRGK